MTDLGNQGHAKGLVLGCPRIMGPSPNKGPAFMLFPTQARGELAVRGELSDCVHRLLPPGNRRDINMGLPESETSQREDGAWGLAPIGCLGAGWGAA